VPIYSTSVKASVTRSSADTDKPARRV